MPITMAPKVPIPTQTAYAVPIGSERAALLNVLSLLFTPALLHADNSPAIEHRAPTPYSLARPGIFLYGVGSGNQPTVEPDPVVALRARIVEIRVFETHPEFRREVWVAEEEGKKFAFDIHLRPSLRGGVDTTIEGPVEIHGSLE